MRELTLLEIEILRIVIGDPGYRRDELAVRLDHFKERLSPRHFRKAITRNVDKLVRKGMVRAEMVFDEEHQAYPLYHLFPTPKGQQVEARLPRLQWPEMTCTPSTAD